MAIGDDGAGPGAGGPSPVLLNVVLGPAFLLALVGKFGVPGWNAWLRSMVDGGFLPVGWSPDEPAPPCWYWLDFSNADFSRRRWDGIDLGLAYLEKVDFNEASLAGARIGCCPRASFMSADLRGAAFDHADVTGVEFCFAKVEGIKLHGATYDEKEPPIGLVDRLLAACRPEPCGEPSGPGADEIPVPVRASLTAAGVPR